jgi:hypothetical protein
LKVNSPNTHIQDRGKVDSPNTHIQDRGKVDSHNTHIQTERKSIALTHIHKTEGKSAIDFHSVLYMCVRAIDFHSVSSILRLDFRTVSKVWYSLLFFPFHYIFTNYSLIGYCAVFTWVTSKIQSFFTFCLMRNNLN